MITNRRMRGVGRTAVAGLVALCCAGCSLSSFFDSTPISAPASAAAYETDYKQIVAGAYTSLLFDKDARPEISPLRRSQAPQPGAWRACARKVTDGTPAFFAFFIEDHKVIDMRSAVAIDGCDQEQYEALARPASAPKKNP
jgi:hypothetical protein